MFFIENKAFHNFIVSPSDYKQTLESNKFINDENFN